MGIHNFNNIGRLPSKGCTSLYSHGAKGFLSSVALLATFIDFLNFTCKQPLAQRLQKSKGCEEPKVGSCEELRTAELE
jgi:hypothetical protein